MTNQLEKILLNALEKTQGAVGKAVDFAFEQAPLVVNELLRYKFIESIIYAASGLIGVLAGAWWLRKVYKNWSRWNENDDSGGGAVIGCIGSAIAALIIGSVCLGVVVVPRALEAVKIGVAPRVYLIEYTADLVKK